MKQRLGIDKYDELEAQNEEVIDDLNDKVFSLKKVVFDIRNELNESSSLLSSINAAMLSSGAKLSQTYFKLKGLANIRCESDEILVNAADVKARETHEKLSKEKRQKMTTLKVEINESTISIYNDGEGIPVEIHNEHNIYVPELIFGHLLTSDNYDDSEARVTGGRNGYGAKLTNIFSKKFSVECVDSSRKRKFKKTWRNNMSTSDQTQVTSCKDTKDYVKVTFEPDLQRFNTTGLSADFISLISKRVYDIAGCCGVKVWLNGKKLPVDSFKDYVDLYFKQPEGIDPSYSKPPLKIHEKSERWEVVVSVSDGQFQQVSFVNAICTIKGGTHVNYVTDPLVQAIIKKVNAKNKGGMELKNHQVRSHLWIFLNCLIVNPTFDSQTKDSLTLKASNFGSKFALSDKTINAVMKSEILELILLWAKSKQQVELQKKLRGTSGKSGKDRILGIPKLEDANDAGTRRADECTLILTEGDSAKTSCVAGLSVLGRDLYGVFPLRGKLLNVREASFKQQVENQEIQAILKIMGLQVGKTIESPKGLRYGSLMIMADQDFDGSHIKGLIINMIAHYWPHLLKCQGFLKEFVTPIVKVTKGNQTHQFFTLAEYENWREQHQGEKDWNIKYYKGLGTSTDKEFKNYFQQLDNHRLEFIYLGDEDLNAIDMAFNGKRAEDRKDWIQAYQEIDYIDYSKKTLTYSDFINKELVAFSKYDTFRSIPNCMDGLKLAQRKVIYAAFKRRLHNEIKVAQLVGYISEKTGYHHGEQSLASTIVGMAQDFVGSNNLVLLCPCGQFGSRSHGGKDAAASRYIFTKLSQFARAIFPEDDDRLLTYLNDDGYMIEPKFYVPVIPLVLVNGSEGIGTGWSSFIPNYNPRDIIANIRRFIRGEPMEPMAPWYRKFKGTIETRSGGFDSCGIITKVDSETLVVTELPVRLWTNAFKLFLEDCMYDKVDALSKSKAAFGAQPTIFINDFRNNSTHENVNFTIKLSPSQMEKAESEGFLKAFRLKKTLSTTNMTLFDPNLKVQKYVSELDIIKEFAAVRLKYYELRKQYLVEKLKRECNIYKNQCRFIQAIIDGSFTLSNKKKNVLMQELKNAKYQTMAEINSEGKLLKKIEIENSGLIDMDEQPPEPSTDTFSKDDYHYLLSMPLWSLTAEKVENLQTKMKNCVDAYENLLLKTVYDLWETDLQKLEALLDEMDKQDRIEAAQNDNTDISMNVKSTFKNSKSKKKMTDMENGTKKKPAARQKTKLKASKPDNVDQWTALSESVRPQSTVEDVPMKASLENRIKSRLQLKSTTLPSSTSSESNSGFPISTVPSTKNKTISSRTKTSSAKPKASTLKTPVTTKRTATKRLKRVSNSFDDFIVSDSENEGSDESFLTEDGYENDEDISDLSL